MSFIVDHSGEDNSLSTIRSVRQRETGSNFSGCFFVNVDRKGYRRATQSDSNSHLKFTVKAIKLHGMAVHEKNSAPIYPLAPLSFRII